MKMQRVFFPSDLHSESHWSLCVSFCTDAPGEKHTQHSHCLQLVVVVFLCASTMLCVTESEEAARGDDSSGGDSTCCVHHFGEAR